MLREAADTTPVAFRGALAALGIALVVRAPLRRSGRRILGAWDPLLRRIELFVDQRQAESPTRTLAHELGHALAADPQSEDAAEAFARDWLKSLTPAQMAEWDAALRGEAASAERAALAAHGDCDSAFQS